MASSSSEAIVPPPPPPPPPLINNDNTNTNTLPNGPTTSQVQVADNGAPTTATDGAKSWQRPWSVDEMRKGATNWSLASDAGLLLYMQEFSQNMLSQTHSMEQKVDGLVHETKGISAKVHNTFNNFLMLSNTQFIENRVYDEEETKDEEEKHSETADQEKEKTREELETEVIPKINEALHSGLAVLDSAFVTVEITPEQISDDEDEGTLPENLKPEPMLELTDVYAHRKLPSFIGTMEFQKDDLVGLGESSSEDEEEASDKEASMESEEEKSTEDDETSESETVSGSESEESSTATESEDEKDVVKKKARKESEQTDSDEGLFAAGGTEKSAKSKHTRDDDEDDSDESEEGTGENEEQPRKPGAPMDFSSELAAKLGVKAKKPVDNSDEEGDNEEGWDESERHGSEASKDDLFSASVDTTTSSKGSKRRNKKHKKPKSRSGSHASHDSAAVTAGNVINELEGSEKHEEDEDDSLFTSSIDTTSSAVSKGSRSKHKHHHKKTARSDSQLSNASSKSGHKERKTASNKEESNLFGGSPEGDLFDEDTSTPFAKKGGVFSGGGGLFDEDMEDEDGVSKPDSVDNSIAKSSHDQDKSDEEIVKPKPRTSSSGKKLPAGAVSIFGDHDPFSHASSAQTSEHHVAKSAPPEKKDPKQSGGGLFSDEGEDIFTSSQSSSIVSTKPPVAAKAAKSVDLFGSGDDEGDDDDDSLFGAKPAKKTEVKAEPPKKKIPAGAVSMFGSGLPPPLFNASNNQLAEPVVSPASTTTKVKTTKEASGLFDEDDDKTSSFASERSAVSSTAVPVAPAVKAKRKTNQISLFDDNENEEEEDRDDLFSSIAPSKAIGSTKTETKPVQSTDTKTHEVSKPTPKRSTISLFDDDEDDEEDEEDIFSIKPSSKSSKPPEVKPSGKSSTPSPGLFGSQGDPLFSGSKPKATETPNEVVDKAHVKRTEQESAVLEDDGDDLFAEPKAKDAPVPAVTPKQEVDKQSEELFDADGDVEAKDEQDGARNTPGRKILPGAVPMFGGVDIFAGQKPAKTTKAKPQGDSLFADDADDLFATAAIPKPAPTLAPRAKPRKPPVEAPQPTTSSPLSETKVSEQSSPEVSSSSKTTNVGKLQRTLAFNPAAMLPGAAPPSKRKEITTEPEIRTKQPIIFNPATMLPGAVPPPRKQEITAEAAFDKPASGKILDSSSRDRARVRGRRRPPTRQARQKAAKESMDDTSLFGSDLTVSSSSHERLTGPKGGQTSLFSDSEDLFGSRSYEPPKTYNQKSHATQSAHASKFDPLFIHNTTASALPSFEDSIDGISTDQNKVSNINTARSGKPKTDPLFHNPLKDDLFSTSTESENSFLPKSNLVESNVPNNEQASKSLFDEKPKDDLFSMSTDSESSVLQRSQVSQVNVPKATKTTTNTESLFDKKSKDDLFSQSTESDISQKPKSEVKKSKADLFSQSTESDMSQNVNAKVEKSKDELFSQSTESDISQKPKSKVEKSKDDLFSQSVESNISQNAKPNEDVPTKKNQNSKTDSLFESKQKEDLFSQSVESKKVSSKNAVVIEDGDEDDLFKSNSRPLFSPPPLDFDNETAESKSKSVDDDIFGGNDIFAPKSSKKKDSENKAEKGFDNEVTESKSKPVNDDIFDDDIFTPKSNKKKDSENRTENEKTKLDKMDDQEEDKQDKSKASEVQKTSAVDDDLFADTGSIFDDLPKKSKEKKKKKAATSKEENIFDDRKDAAASEDASTSKTTKKTKGKKKGKSKISIFDEDSPSIFDDPLNATSK